MSTTTTIACHLALAFSLAVVSSNGRASPSQYFQEVTVPDASFMTWRQRIAQKSDMDLPRPPDSPGGLPGARPQVESPARSAPHSRSPAKTAPKKKPDPDPPSSNDGKSKSDRTK
jgi:hypothetical protein